MEVIHPKLRVDQTMSQPPVTDVGTCVALTLVQSCMEAVGPRGFSTITAVKAGRWTNEAGRAEM